MTTSDGVSSSGLYGFKNRIINGGMTISQRNGTTATANGSNAYCLDRWAAYGTVVSKYTTTQSTTAPTGFSNSLLVTSSAATTVGSGDYYFLIQRIEGNNVSDLALGTANAKPFTLSFWVQSSLTGTFGGSFRNSASSRSYPISYTISSANTWEQKSITVAGDTSGTWLTTNGIGILLFLSLGSGSTYSGTAGSWSGSVYTSATGATSVVGTNGATFYITGVQLEKGSTATSFDYRPYGTELALCQRYYNMVANYSQTGGVAPITNIVFPSATDIRAIYNFPVQMRVAPSVVSSSGSQYFRIYNGNNIYANSIGLDFASVSGIGIVSGGGTSGATQGQGGIIFANTAGAYFALSAEL
jgi:hypothetical protein